MTRVRLALLASVLAAAMLVPGAAQADASPWHWAYRNPTVVDGTGHAATEKANKFAVDNWNAAGANIQLLYRIDTTACARPARYREIVVCYRPLGHPGGETHNTATGADGPYHLTSSDVSYDPEAKNRTQYSLDALACHELGHTLGLAHHDDPNEGCMNPATQQDRPGTNDTADLRSMYRHLDQYGAPQPGPAASPSPYPPPRTCGLFMFGACWFYRS